MLPLAVLLTGSAEAPLVARTLVSIAVLLLAARLMGEVARTLGQASVLGEIAAGVLLGPALFGRVAPEAAAWLFPASGPSYSLLEGLRALAVTLFLLVAGLEVDLSRVLRQGRAASLVGVFGIAVPFGLGLALAWSAPAAVGWSGLVSPELHALFFATALSISALPVIARTLLDLRLYRTDFGMVVIAAAIFNDLIGWTVFALILGVAGAAENGALPVVVASIGAFVLVLLTVGRWAIHRVLPWVQAHTSWPSGVLVFAIVLALLCGAISEELGLHAIFGAFLAGVALGDSAHLRERTRTTIREFVSSFFAPLFFAGIGLSVDFVAHFDPVLCALVMLVACVGKIYGARVGGALAGMAPREAWAVGFAMNARGSMEVVLGLTALRLELIDERMFVALVAMAMATSVLSGPLIQRVIGLQRPRRFARYLAGRAFVGALAARDRRGAIRELAAALAPAARADAAAIEAAVWEREERGTTAIGKGIALPHARLAGLARSWIAFGLAPGGIEFDAADGEPARFVFLIVTPAERPGEQLEILADIGRVLDDSEVRAKLLLVRTWTELLAALRADVEAR